ncbi:hypothetical protein NQ318_015521 [Aromia moschata]|uniref:DDE-1 domain-containing protein n=1 Tax=Aromia moschata TaxID=1265417 RepID=A0AAV8XRH0_9CUCU|nr:hypothetical protein NQ318_015521 [Aromia moschata]
MAKWGFALTKEEVKSAVQTYVNENNIKTTFKEGKPGDDWFRLFCKRNRLSQKKMEQLEKCRRKATSDTFIIYGFYDLLDRTIKELGLEDKPSHIFNLDESSFSMDPNRVKGVAARGQNLWSTWKGKNDLENTCYAASDKGWMATVIFNSWFEKFCNMVPQRPLLVIMDGHVTHLDVGTIELAIHNNITLIKLPPHTTDLLQPLDKCCFGPWKLKWNQELITWQRENQRKLTKSEFADKICKLWHHGITAEAIKSSFLKTGIYPCDRNKYPTGRLDETKLQRYNETPITPFNIVEQDDEELNNEGELNDVDEICSEVENGGNQDAEGTLLAEGNEEAENLAETATLEKDTDPVAPSSSFENILLRKINKTIVETQRRRKIDSGSAVLTSTEYIKLMKEKEDGKKKREEKKSDGKSTKSDEKRTNDDDRRTVKRQKGERKSGDRRTNDDDKRAETRRRGVIRKFTRPAPLGQPADDSSDSIIITVHPPSPAVVIPTLTIQTPSPTHSASPSALFPGSPPPHKSQNEHCFQFPALKPTRKGFKNLEKPNSLDLPCPPPMITVTCNLSEVDSDTESISPAVKPPGHLSVASSGMTYLSPFSMNARGRPHRIGVEPELVRLQFDG